MQTKRLPPLLVLLLLILGYSCKKNNGPGPDPFIHVSRTELEVGNYAGYTDTVVITSNVNWTISVDAGAGAWLSVDPVKKATGDSTIVTIKVNAANAGSSQTALITVTPTGANSLPLLINISRKAYSLVWQKCYGGTGVDQCYATALLPNDQFVTAGYSSSVDGDAAGNNGQYLGWTLGVGSDGNKRWQQQTGVYGTVYRSVVASPDGGVVCAGNLTITNRLDDISVVKFDANGNVVWNKTYGGSNNEKPYKIITTADGGYLVSGEARSQDGDVKSNHGGSDVWVIKLDANGDLIWGKTFGGANDELFARVAACSDGGYVLLSTTESTNSGDVQGSHGFQDLFVVKIDANGNKVWARTIGGSSFETSSSVIGDTDGGCILLGYTISTDGDVVGKRGADYDAWVLKLTKDGQLGWQVVPGGSGNDVGYSMARLPDGHIAIAGNSDSNDRGITGNHGPSDIWMLVMNSTGKVVWQKLFGSSQSDTNVDLVAAADGSLLVTNLVTGNDGDVSGNHGWMDTWIFKLK